MGIIRKTMSVSTLGLVDYRSDKERIAKYTRQTRNAVRKQTKEQVRLADLESQQRQTALMQQQTQIGQHHLTPAPAQIERQPSSQVPAGWYATPNQPGIERWWDGYTWTETTRPAATQ